MPANYPGPEGLEGSTWTPMEERRSIPTEGAHAAAWVRVSGPLSDDPITQACALAYASDDIPTDAASKSHPRHPDRTGDPKDWGEIFIGASLDHTIWFHRPGRNDEWALHDFQGHGVVGGRGLTVGQIYTQGGVHMATVSQEILIRERTR